MDTTRPPPEQPDLVVLGGTEDVRRLGSWLARASFGIGVAYVIVFVVGFSSMGDLSKPLKDPYLPIAEILIVILAPILVLLMVVVHECAPARARIYSGTAVCWMMLTAGFTMTVHLVLLMGARRIDPASLQGFQNFFGWHWPSVFYSIDIVAWDVFFGLALLFAAPVFHVSRHFAARNGLLAAGALSLIGTVGPAINHIARLGSSGMQSFSPSPASCSVVRSRNRSPSGCPIRLKRHASCPGPRSVRVGSSRWRT